jgi:hypothetical protein
MAHELTVRGAAAIRQLAEVLRTYSPDPGIGRVWHCVMKTPVRGVVLYER